MGRRLRTARPTKYCVKPIPSTARTLILAMRRPTLRIAFMVALIWVNRSEHEHSRLASIPDSNSCQSTTHACGIECGGNRTEVHGIPQCKAFHATGYCTTTREVCESDACQHGTWLPVSEDFHHPENVRLPVMV